MVLSYLFRVYAKTRLEHLRPWIDLWITDDMFGYRGSGATDAWMETAAHIEKVLVHNGDLCGGGVDVHKCFDTVARNTLRAIAQRAGFPVGVRPGTTFCSRRCDLVQQVQRALVASLFAIVCISIGHMCSSGRAVLGVD